jgi:hypothetical protein
MGWLGMKLFSTLITLGAKLFVEKAARPRLGDRTTNAMFDAGKDGYLGDDAIWGQLRWWIGFIVIVVGGTVLFIVVGNYAVGN